MKEIELKEIKLNEIDSFIGCEAHMQLLDGNLYTGIIKDIYEDDQEILLSNPLSKVSLGFQLSWIKSIYVLQTDYDKVMKGED